LKLKVNELCAFALAQQSDGKIVEDHQNNCHYTSGHQLAQSDIQNYPQVESSGAPPQPINNKGNLTTSALTGDRTLSHVFTTFLLK
jgi:hypothetical protein